MIGTTSAMNAEILQFKTMRPRKSKHHILNTRIDWSARPESLALRESPPLIPLIDQDVHDEIHRIAPAVPALGIYALKMINRLYVPEPSTIRSIDNLLTAIDTAGNHPRAHRIERIMADCAIEAIEIQRAILRGQIE